MPEYGSHIGKVRAWHWAVSGLKSAGHIASLRQRGTERLNVSMSIRLLVLLGGDNTTGKATKKEFKTLLEDIARPMEDRKIPWAHIFGNHDISPKVSKEYQQKVYEEYPFCLSKAGPKALPGVGNYFLPVLDGYDSPVFGIWALDSHQDFKTPSADFGYTGDLYWDLLMPGRLGGYYVPEQLEGSGETVIQTFKAGAVNVCTENITDVVYNAVVLKVEDLVEVVADKIARSQDQHDYDNGKITCCDTTRWLRR